MGKRVFSRVRSPRKRNSEFSAVSDEGMFESRPFVVQSKVGEEGEKSIQQSSNLKIQLSRATSFGHNLSQMPAVQNKAGIGLENQAVQRQVEQEQPIQRKIIARIRTIQGDAGSRVISGIRLEGRAPTDVPGSNQGDHTVAETLINESVIREIEGMPRKLALNNLMVLARLTLPETGVDELNAGFVQLWNAFDSMEGEDKNSALEDFIQRYIELANKRPGTAFLRNQEVTRGRGSERKHIGLVRNLANKLEQQMEITEQDLLDGADGISGLIDMKFVVGEEKRYLNLVFRALDHAVFSVLPQLTEKHRRGLIYWLMVKLKQRDSIPDETQNIYLEELQKRYHFTL